MVRVTPEHTYSPELQAYPYNLRSQSTQKNSEFRIQGFPQMRTVNMDSGLRRAFTLQTVKQGMWDVIINFSPTKSPTPQNISLERMKKIMEELEGKQSPPPPESCAQGHTDAINLIATNWETVFTPLLFGRQDPSLIYPTAYTEVTLGSAGKPDIAAIARIGEVVLIEVGTRRKSNQIWNYVDGVRKLFSDPSLKVKPLVAVYEPTLDTNQLIISEAKPRKNF